jgi:hypothetical protein
MKLKFLSAIILGLLWLSFFTSTNTFAESSDSMIEKQKEIDQYIFVDKKEELEERGITVTHTGPLENTVEIGILPYTQENITYFQDVFGKDQVTIVDGQIAVTFTAGDEEENALINEPTEEKSKAVPSPFYLIALLIVLAGIMIAIQKKRKATK